MPGFQDITVEVPKNKYGGEDEGYVADVALAYGDLATFVPQATGRPHVTLAGAGEFALPVQVGAAAGAKTLVRWEGMNAVNGGAAFQSGVLLMSNAVGRAILHVTAAWVVGVSMSPCQGATHRVAMEAMQAYR